MHTTPRKILTLKHKTPKTKSHEKDTIKSLIAKIDKLKKRVLELKGIYARGRQPSAILTLPLHDRRRH